MLVKKQSFILTQDPCDRLSTHANTSELMHDQVGTIYYVAPEVLFGEYTSKADIWSIGVVAYVLLCGFAPFNAGSESRTYNIVKEGPGVTFPSPAWDKISPEAKRFVRKLMDRDPDKRPSAAEAMEDPWVNTELAKNPFRRLWHGTFVSPASKEFERSRDKLVSHADRNRRDTFHRDYSQKQLLKKTTPKQQTRKKIKKKKKKKKKIRLWLTSSRSTDDDENENDDE